MGLHEFVRKLQEHGWYSEHDAQWERIEVLWRELFPCHAKLHDLRAEQANKTPEPLAQRGGSE